MATTEELDRILPVNLEAERSVLGAILLDNTCYDQAAAKILPEDFSLDSHRKIYQRIAELGDHGQAVDFITLAEALSTHRQLDNVGGVAYLASLTDGLPRASNIEHYVAIVRDKAMLRSIIHMAHNAALRATGEDAAADVLADIQETVIELVRHGREGVAVDVRQAARDTYEMHERTRNFVGEVIGLPTGLAQLDELTTGYREDEFYVIGARPGQGKTAFMCQGVRAQVKGGHRPGVFSAELPRTQIINRLACQEMQLSVFDTRDNRVMSSFDYSRLQEGIAEVGEWPFFMEDTPRLSVKKMAAIARVWIAQGCDCIWVDYLQKMRAPGKTEYEQVTYIANALWELARTTRVPVVALSQLKRTEKDRPPTLEDLRSSGEIEQNARGAYLIYRPKSEFEEGGETIETYTGEDQIIIAKQTSGPSSIHVRARFDGPVGIFRPR